MLFRFVDLFAERWMLESLKTLRKPFGGVAALAASFKPGERSFTLSVSCLGGVVFCLMTLR